MNNWSSIIDFRALPINTAAQQETASEAMKPIVPIAQKKYTEQHLQFTT